MSKLNEFRKHQAEADDAINEELLINNKCIVKMFCGTGKSLLMRKMKSAQNQQLVVYVFPSLSLIDQFCTDYFTKVGFASPFKISSDKDMKESEDANGKKTTKKTSTTNPEDIINFIKEGQNKIICVTYQSYKTLLDNLGSIKIDVCIYDEAHHAVGETYQKLIFENETNACEKQIFFTATPKNANGIVMYDRDNLDAGMCGKLVYDYSYLRGLADGYLNPFEIRVDMYTENTNKSVYESIARTILESGNNRVLTFHADVSVESESKTSVRRFAHEKCEEEFEHAFMKVIADEFPEKEGLYKQFKMIALDASIPTGERRTILDKLDTTLDNEVYIISSCETIGEGIDTKNANMCVFVDPKSSFVKIKQNIGRIVRPQSKPSTVLITCWVDKTKYVGCDKDREKCDEVIRSDLNKDGNFNGILNVLSALRQEDEDLYDICLHYPDTYSPQEVKSNLEKHGYKVLDQIGDGELVETMEYLLDEDIDYDDYEDCETNEEMIMRIAEDNDVCVEVHTNSFENQIEKYNSECESGEIIRLYKEEYDEEDVNQVFCPIVKKCGKRKGDGSIKELNKKDRIKIDVHTNPDVKVLWKLVGDFTKEICSCVLDCEVDVVDRWFERFEELKKFIDENKRRPTECSRNKNEKTIGRWLSHQKQNYKKGMMNGERCDLWEKFIKDYSEYLQNWDDKWFCDFNKLKNFIDINKRKPIECSEIFEEKQIGIWYRTQQQQYKNSGIKIKERCILWEKFLTDYSEYLQNWDDKWFCDFNKLKQFIDINKRKPLEKSKIKNEKTIGQWLSTQLKNYNSCIHSMNTKYIVRREVWSQFMKEYKQHFTSKKENWFEQCEELKVFMNNNNKTPRQGGHNRTENEKIMGQWLSHQIKNYKKKLDIMKDPEIYSHWTQFLEEHQQYFTSKTEKWVEQLEELKMFMNNNNKTPRQSGNNRNENEKIIGNWLSHQIKNYKKKLDSMKDPEIYSQWTQFLEEYKQYFDNTLDDNSVEEETIKPKKSMKLKEITTKEPKEPKESQEQRQKRTKSELSVLHQRYKTLTSQNLQKEFQGSPELWHQYHAISEENEKSFPEESIPRNRIIQELTEIKGKRTRSVVDMGCGKAQIAEHFANDSRFTFINYDHVSSKENVLVQDISQTPLEDDSVEICILCLAMWGSNCHDYVREAYRILESGGKLYIMEATKRWTSVATESVATESVATESEGGEPGDKLKNLLEETGFQIVKSSVEKFCLFVCSKI
jgi:superfamily II DNA or RNA helicase